MDSPTSANPGSETAASGGSLTRSLLRLSLRVSALAATTFAIVLCIVLFVPDGNDYARATLLKHERLASLAGPKIVFVGGSNLAYGLDSAMVERALHRPVVNMGMNGYFGVRYMLEEVKPFLRPSDVVVLSFEYDNYFKSADGTSTDLLMVAKTNPQAISYLSWKQRWGVLETLPYVAQQKVLRLLKETGQSVKKTDTASEGAGVDMVEFVLSIESLAGYNAYGDLVSHLGVKWPVEREDGLDASNLPIDHGVIEQIQDFVVWADRSGVRVVVSYTAVIDYYYKKHQVALERVHALLKGTPGLVVPSPPSTYVFPEPWFFDTVYHLNEQGRRVRSERVIQDIQQQLSAAPAKVAQDPQNRVSGE